MSNKHSFENSSSISHCEYEDETNTLHVYFMTSATWHKFKDVPKEIYDQLKTAESPGKFYHANIRGKYKNG